MPTPRELNRDRVARWRAAHPARARSHCRAYYHRKKMQDPAALAAWNLEVLRRLLTSIDLTRETL